MFEPVSFLFLVCLSIKIFPTFLQLDADMKTMGRLRYAKAEIPSSFGEQIDEILRLREGDREAKANAMSPKDAAAFRQAYVEYKNTKSEVYNFCMSQQYHTKGNVFRLEKLTKDARIAREIFFQYYD